MRRTLHIAAWTLGSIVALALLLIGALLILGNTGYGRRLMEHEVSSLTSGKVQVSGLSGTFPSALNVASVQITDTRGVWMRAERVSIRWSPLALLHAVLHVGQFQIGTADVLRRPVSTASAGGSSSRSHLPSVDIDRLAIDTLLLEPAAAGTRTSVTVQGDAHYRSARNARAQLAIRRSNGSGHYLIDVALAATGVNARLQLQEPAGGPIEQLANLPGLGALSINANIEGPRTAERLQLAGQVGALSTEAHGTLDLTSRAGDVSFALHSAAMTPQPGLSWTRVALQGSVHGRLATPRASGSLELEGLRLPDGAQLGSLRASASADGHLLTLKGLAAGILLPASQPQLLEDSPLTLAGTLRLDATDHPLQLTLTHRLFALQASALTEGNRSASFELHLPDLAPLAALYHQNLRGSLTLSGTLSQSGQLMRAEVHGMGSLTGASPAAQLLGAHTRLQLAATLNAAALDLQQLTLSGHALTLAVTGSAQRAAGGSQGLGIRSLQAQWRVSLPNLALISPTIAGSLQTTGSAQGPLNALATDIRARSTLAVRGGPPGNFEASLQAKGLPSTPTGNLHAHGTFDGSPLQLDAAVTRLANAQYRVVFNHAAWKSFSAHGDLTAGSNLAASHGQLQLHIERLADLQSLIGARLAGSLAAKISLVPSASRPHAQFELIASNVKFNALAAQARLSGAGPLNALRIQLTAASSNLGGSPANVSASAQLNALARALELERFQMHYHGQAVQLVSRSRITYAHGLSIRNLRLAAGHAAIAIDGVFSPALDFRASVHGVDARLVDAFDPGLLAAGSLNADVRLHGTRSAPIGQASLRVTGVKLARAAAQGLPAVDASASARLAGSSGDVFMQLKAGSASHMQLSGRVPLNPSGRFAVKLAGRLDLALTNSLLAQQGKHAAGILTVAASANGTARAPQISGTVQLAHGDLRDYPQGIHLSDINAELVGAQGSLRIASMTARAGPGQLSMSGTVGVLQPQMPLDITVKGQRIQPIVNDILTANLNTNLHVAGTLRQRLDVTGNVHINHAAIDIPNGFPPSVAVLHVIVPGQKPPPAAKTQLVIALGIDVDAPASIFVQGRGLDAQLGGKLQLTGTSDKPLVGGAFNMIRGTYSLAGTNIKFTSGRVSFNGEGLKDKIDPTLDFLAQASVTYNSIPTVVNLNVTGFADAPQISLSSTPPLPQDDLLALLLFGRPASQLSVLQVAEIGAAVASLSGIGGGSGGGGKHSLNPLTWIKHALGLNAFSVGGAAPPAGAAAGAGSTISGASVTAGKYVSNRVYVAATQSTTGTSQVQVDVDLNAGVKLQTRLGNGTATAQGTTPQNDPGSSIGLTWQHRY
ncbi:MAG TPA: translocation/assembly module TamB domain-containing protein [Steroidobacteraceae bacterium]|nr:translocation/assembly module TamB domain-containing protein [Steroidobacteraceae bacterium]